jgi:hypothetical protein
MIFQNSMGPIKSRCDILIVPPKDKTTQSSKKLTYLVDKLNNDMVKLEKTTTYLVEMMKDEEGDGDDDIWVNAWLVGPICHITNVAIHLKQ